MWEDVAGWNSYADQPSSIPDFSSFGAWSNSPDVAGQSWSTSPTSWSSQLDFNNSQNGDPSQQTYNYYRDVLGGGDVNKAADIAVSDRWTGGLGQSLPLRDAEHALVSESFIKEHPIVGPLAVGMGVPAYTGLKYLAQNVPGINNITRFISPEMGDFTQATPASWQELLWGLKPFWFNPYRPVR